MANEPFSRRLWISFGIIAASVIIAGVALYFFSGDLAANASEIILTRTALNTQNSAVANLASLKHEASVAAQYQMAMGQLLPDQYGLVTFTQWFAAEGLKYGVDANAEFQGAATPSQGATPGGATFSFSASGSLSNIDSFMDFVGSKSPAFLVSFSTFNITGSGTGYNATGQGTVFSQ